MPATSDQFSNFGVSLVAGGAGGPGTALNAGDTQMTVKAGDGAAKFPAAAPFMVSFGAGGVGTELAKCTAISGDALTLLRGQEGTTAQLWPAGTQVQCVVTAGSLADVWSAINRGRNYYIKDYGAKCDGATVDDAAWAAAISAANSAGGGVVFHGGGTSIVSTPIAVNNDRITVMGVGEASVIRPSAGFTGAALIASTGAQYGCVRDLFMDPGNGTYSSNPACAGIQLSSSVTDIRDWVITNVQIHNLNGWAIETLVPAHSNGYLLISDVIGRGNKQGCHFQGGGLAITNCIMDGCQVGDCWFFENSGDNTMSSCQGYTFGSGSCLHIKGGGQTFFSSLDLGGNGTSGPCVLIEQGTSQPKHLSFEGLYIQYGTVGVQINSGDKVRFTNCDIQFNQTHGVQVANSSNVNDVLFSACTFFQNNTTSTPGSYDFQNLSTNGSTAILIDSCQFSNNGATTLAACIDAAAPSGYPNNAVTVRNCQFNQRGAYPAFSARLAARISGNYNCNPLGAALAAPGTPVASTSGTSGGGVPAGTYQVQTTIANATGETTPSAAASVTTTGVSSVLVVSAPAQPANGGPIGWYVYVTQASGTVYTRQQGGGPTGFGTNVVLTTTPTTTGLNPPATNTTGVVTPSIPSSGGNRTNNSGVDCAVYLTGASIASVSVGGAVTGLVSGMFRVPAGLAISVSYTGTPAWAWFGE